MGRIGGGVVLTLVSVIALAGGGRAAAASAGDLDTSFGQNGIATVDLHHNANVSALAIAPDGHVLVAGTAISTSGATTDVVAARFTAAGAVDTSYGGGDGVVQPDFGQNESASAAVLQPDGKLVIAGDSTNAGGGSQLLAARFNSDGALDNSFGSGGKTTLDFTESSDFGRAVALAPGGRIVIAGFASLDSNRDVSIVARLNADASADKTFWHDGDAVHSVPGGDDSLAAVAVDPDGSIVGAGANYTTPGTPASFSLSRIEASGGWSSTGADLGGTEGATAVALLPNGKVLVAGYTNTNGTYDFAVSRFTSDLELDRSFATNGTAIIDLGGAETASAMTLQSDGKIIVVGSTVSASGKQIGVVRLLPGGQLDPSFGTNGVAKIGASGAVLQGFAVGLQPSGDIIVGGTIRQPGSSQQNMLLVRIHGSASSASGGGSPSGGAGSGPTGSGGAPTSTPAPALKVLAVAHTTLRVGAALPALNPARAPKAALIVTFSLSEAASLTITIARERPGERSRGRCRPRASTHVAHRCTAHTTVLTLHYTGVSGTNHFAFAGRLPNAKALGRGAYTLAITASAGGGHAAAKALSFRVSSG